jgi:hypothetical protein
MDRRSCEFLRNSEPIQALPPSSPILLSPERSSFPVSLWQTLRFEPAVPHKFKLGKEIET